MSFDTSVNKFAVNGIHLSLTILRLMALFPASIIVTTHNRADLLPGVISHLRAQKYPLDLFEIVVVDNCSTDHTARTIEKLAIEPGASLRYVVEPHLGVTYARNKGAEVAQYPYLAYVDDDCITEPDWLWYLMQGFDLHDNVVAVGGKVILHWEQQEEPSWMSPKLELWLGANGYLGTNPRLLDENERIREGNMVLKRDAWLEAGGFVGMEQFGSKHMAASEVVYLLKQLHQRGGKIAYSPKAVVHHHVYGRTKQWMLQRAYWQGVSDATLEYLLSNGSNGSIAYRLSINLAALFTLMGFTLVSYSLRNDANRLYHLMRAIRRLGLLLGELHIAGNWQHIHSWAELHETC